MSTLLHDERIPAALLTIVMHITVVSAIAMVAASLARRHAAFRQKPTITASRQRDTSQRSANSPR